MARCVRDRTRPPGAPAKLGIILLLLLANGVIGFWEEHQAGNAIAALKATLAIKARVKRDGKWVNPAARAGRRDRSAPPRHGAGSARRKAP